MKKSSLFVLDLDIKSVRNMIAILGEETSGNARINGIQR
jgi:hypothetical protein